MEYVKGKLLGSVAFGTVHLATTTTTTNFGHNRDHSLPSTFAVKTTSSTFGSSLQNEAYALSQLPYSPRIIRCLGGDCKLEPSTGDTLYNLFLEYVSGGSLSDRCGKLDELTVRRYTREILEGLAHIHRHGFVHCDVKPDNILLDPSFRIKIADFGFAKRTREETSKKAMIRGTPMYMSPEVVVEKEPEPKSDVWSLGCTVIELVSGKPPWDVPVGGVDNAVQLLFKIGRCGKSPEIPPEISEEGRDFLTRCLERDPRERWTAEMLLHHEFVKQNGVDTASRGATAVSDRFLSTVGSLDSLCWSRSSCRSSLWSSFSSSCSSSWFLTGNVHAR